MPPINQNIKQVPVTSPIKGVNTVVPREGQLPDTCWNAVNVVPYDRWGRKRVAQRPGTDSLYVYPNPSFVQNLTVENSINYQSSAFSSGDLLTIPVQSVGPTASFTFQQNTYSLAMNGQAVNLTIPFTLTQGGANSSPNTASATVNLNGAGQILKLVASQETSGSQISITSLTSSGTVASATTATAHGFTAGESVEIAGASPFGYTGNVTVSATGLGSTTFQYTLRDGGSGLSAPATGTITASATLTGAQTQIYGPPGLVFLTPIWNKTVVATSGATLTFTGTVTINLIPSGGLTTVTLSSTIAGSTTRTVSTTIPYSNANAPLQIQLQCGGGTAVGSTSIGPIVLASAVAPGATPVNSAAYTTSLYSVVNGFVYSGFIVPAKAANQTTAPLKTNVLVSSARLFNEIYYVDGTTIAQLDIPSLTMIAYAATAGSTPNSTISTSSQTLASGALTSSGTVASAATPANHGWTVGDTVTISGATPAGYDGTVTILTVPTANTFTYTLPNGGTGLSSPATGTIVVTGPYVGPLTTCSLACNWRGRLVLAGDSGAPQNFYMSRLGVPTDWNYGATDGAQAVAGNLSVSGLIGEPIVALIPFTDDILIIGCTHSIWLIQGDLAQNGTIVQVSANIGILGANAWQKDSFDALYFVGTGGLYTCRPLWEQWQPPKLLTGETFNQFFQGLSPSANIITLVWDEDARYLYMFFTPNNDASLGTHLLYDTRNEGMWPLQYPQGHGPTAAIQFFADGTPNYRGVLMGGFDGSLRRLDPASLDDDGTPISSTITLGPFHPFPEAALLSGTTIDFGEADPQSFTWGFPTAVLGEVPVPPPDGSTQDFNLANGPVILDTVQVFNGTLQLINNIDYQVDTGGDLFFFVAPLAQDVITVNYSYQAATNPVPWNVQVTIESGPDAFEVTEGKPHSSLAINSVIERRQKTFRQRLRGGWFSVTLSNSQPDTYFSFESMMLEFKDSGRNRERR